MLTPVLAKAAIELGPFSCSGSSANICSNVSMSSPKSGFVWVVKLAERPEDPVLAWLGDTVVGMETLREIQLRRLNACIRILDLDSYTAVNFFGNIRSLRSASPIVFMILDDWAVSVLSMAA